MLPFLKAKPQAAGIAMIERKPDEPSHEEDGIMSAARDLLQGIEMKDHKAIAAAMRAAFEILDSEPHVEGEHIESKEE